MATNLFAGLRRIAELFFLRLEGEQVNTEHPDPVQLKQAYRDLTNLGALVDTVAGFIFAGGIKVESEDEEASAVCDEFNDRNEEELQTAVRESCLYGFTWLLPFWSVSDSEGPCSSLRVYSPSAVQLLTSETSDPSDSSDPSDLPRAIITSTINLRRTVQTITPTTWRIEVNGRQTQSGPNPLGMIPIVPVHLGRFSDDLFGSSVISDALYQTLREKAILRKKGISLERRQSTLLAVNGRATVDVLKPKLDRISGDSPAIPTVFLQDPKGSVNFVESRRGPEGIIELLQLLYHDAIVDGKIPEYLLGVGMPSAQASTKEQRAKVEALVTPLRSSWKKGLRQLNRIVLKLHELHEIRSFVTDVTSVSFGPLFEKDESAAADTLQRKSAALVQLNSLGILSRETAQESIPELIPDVVREASRLKSEAALADPYPNPTAPTDSSNPSEEPEKPVSAQESTISAMEGRWVTIEGRHILLGGKGGGGGAGGGGGVGAAVGGDLVAASGETPGGAKYWVQQDTDPTGDDVKSPEAQVEANGKVYRGTASLKDGNVVVHDAGRKITVTVKPEDAADVKRVFESHQATEAAREQVMTQQVPGLSEVRAASEAHHVANSRYEAARETAAEHEDFRPATKPSPALAERHAAVREQYPRAALYVQAERQATSGSWADNTGKQAAGREAMKLIRKGASLDEAKAALGERRPLND